LVGIFLQDQLKKAATSPRQWQLYNKEFYDLHTATARDRAAILSSIYDAAQRNPAFGKVFDEVYGIPLFNIQVGDKGAEILQTNPNLAQQEAIKDIAAGANVTVETVKSVEAKLSQVIARLNELGKDNPATDVMQLLLQQQQQRIQEERNKFEMDGLRSALFVVSFLMPDKRAAQRLSAVGNAILDFKSVTDQYNRLYRDGASQSASAMGTAMFTMNYFAIFFALVDVLAKDESPSPEMILSQQIRELAKQMEEFQKENRQRFDRIDLALSQL
jgi:hypothetical protein